MFAYNAGWFFSSLKLRTKLFLAYISANTLVAFVGAFIILTTVRTAAGKVYDDLSLSFNESRVLFYNQLYMNYLVSDVLTQNTVFLSYLNRYYLNPAQYFSGYFNEIQLTVNSANLLINNKQPINIYVDNPTILYEKYILRPLDDTVRRQPWFDGAMSAGDMVVYNSGGGVIMARRLSERLNPTTVAMQISMDRDYFLNICRYANHTGSVYLLKRDGTVLFSQSREDTGASFFAMYPGIDRSIGSGGAPMRYGGNMVWIDRLSSNSRTSDLLMANVFPAETVSKSMMDIFITPLLLFVLGIAASMFVIGLFVNNMVKRITRLTTFVKKVEEGDFNININAAGSDELDALYTSFNQMTGRINNLINIQNVYAKKLLNFEYKTKEAELLSLQSQIDPHFLVNFLEAVRAKLINASS